MVGGLRGDFMSVEAGLLVGGTVTESASSDRAAPRCRTARRVVDGAGVEVGLGHGVVAVQRSSRRGERRVGADRVGRSVVRDREWPPRVTLPVFVSGVAVGDDVADVSYGPTVELLSSADSAAAGCSPTPCRWRSRRRPVERVTHGPSPGRCAVVDDAGVDVGLGEGVGRGAGDRLARSRGSRRRCRTSRRPTGH